MASGVSLPKLGSFDKRRHREPRLTFVTRVFIPHLIAGYEQDITLQNVLIADSGSTLKDMCDFSFDIRIGWLLSIHREIAGHVSDRFFKLDRVDSVIAITYAFEYTYSFIGFY